MRVITAQLLDLVFQLLSGFFRRRSPGRVRFFLFDIFFVAVEIDELCLKRSLSFEILEEMEGEGAAIDVKLWGLGRSQMSDEFSDTLVIRVTPKPQLPLVISTVSAILATTLFSKI